MYNVDELWMAPAPQKAPGIEEISISSSNADVYKKVEEYSMRSSTGKTDEETIQGKKGMEMKVASTPTSLNQDRDSRVLNDPELVVYDQRRGKTVVVPQVLAMHLLGKENEHPILVVGQSASQDAVVYIYQNGFYQQANKRMLSGYVKTFLPARYRTPADIASVCYEINTEPSRLTMDDLDNDENIINFENGLLHLDTGELAAHSPDVLSTVRIPCFYRPELTLDDAPVTKRFLEELTDGDGADFAFIMEFIGAILSNVPGHRFKKLLVLEGPGDTGKSQLRQLVVDLIGPKNCHTLDLSIMGNRFGTSQLYGKRLVGSGDMSFAKIKEISTLKELTGGDDINAEFKGQDAFTFCYRGFLWFNCNELPQFSGDRGRHVYERFCIVHCGNVIPREKQDRTLLAKMIAEKEVLVSVAIQYFREAVKRNYTFTESECMGSLREEYAEKNNSLITFIRECCNLRDGRIKRSEFNTSYIAWCRNNEMYIEPSRNIGPTLDSVFHIKAGKSGEVYYPLSIKPEAQIPSSQYKW